ncbi:hypothetical protein G6011_08048 [Alternaria panax]|uniref:Cytochrome P450 monooxygenase n=1 Tax=Alternaria panax TaxID=48097 RepID=A0AAD4I7F5_9PLEO|nr:hypothetical protein G6011_08048 [Alternaria panax]
MTLLPATAVLQYLSAGAAALLVYVVYAVAYNLYLHPLAKFPGPLLAGATTYWKAYTECIANRSFCHFLVDLHAQYGQVVRIGPNELHFANPKAYHDIYNNKNRWDKEATLYRSFNEDRSSFGYLTYAEAKNRKDVLNKSFSLAAIESSEGLLVSKVKELCAAIEKRSKEAKSVDLFYAFRCMSVDVITTFCFGKSIHAVDEPDFKAPIVVALEAATPLLSAQINELTDDPEKLKLLPHNMTIYHRLMDPDAHRGKQIPSAGSLYEEAQALMFGGTDTVGNTLMVGAFHLLRHPDKMAKLKVELSAAWPSLEENEPTVRDLERLPYLSAVIKEALRMSSGVTSGLLRIVPKTGATIAGHEVPPQTIVSCGSTFVHFNADIFPGPNGFLPERWLDESADLDKWLVAFSRGPRMCLGINLAWAELRLGFGYVFRKFDLEPQGQL